MDLASSAAALGFETWETEFEGHTISIFSDKDLLAAARSLQTSQDRMPLIFSFIVPADVADDDTWGFVARLLQHEWRTQRQNHTYPPDVIFAGAAKSNPLQEARYFNEASPDSQDPPVLFRREGRLNGIDAAPLDIMVDKAPTPIPS
ncbi:hypothetical protein BP00DRAFT_414699 [Aspergillus indologenus CBS 114.80]|uniref:Uncharacterized protein n=1 Tax=Aspergillus indologenus CBS 114.80 TaxID=1450541 RepID=A0A2V5I6W8_9EURO|nr:hypothetical protein BP00DRAFT_414699 [Aspergillus indologenus CBS 114.80]